MNIANQAGAAIRADLNNAFLALVTNSSGTSAPTTTFAYQFWVDTSGSSPLLKMRDGANADWITIGPVDVDGLGQLTALTGDIVAGGGGSQVATIQNGVVTNAKLATMSTLRFKARLSSGIGAPEDLTVTQATAILNSFVGDSGSGGTKGLVPAPGTGDAAAGKFLKADGTFAVPVPSPDPSLVPAGAILPYGGSSSPANYLLCDGSSYLRSAFPSLFTAIGTAYGAADGTHFNVPDLRGQFLRGVDGTAGRDPDKASRTAMNTGGNTGNNVGSVQSDQNKAHIHTIPNSVETSGGATNVGVGGSTLAFIVTTSTASSGGNESRPINAYVNYIIKT